MGWFSKKEEPNPEPVFNVSIYEQSTILLSFEIMNILKQDSAKEGESLSDDITNEMRASVKRSIEDSLRGLKNWDAAKAKQLQNWNLNETQLKKGSR